MWNPLGRDAAKGFDVNQTPKADIETMISIKSESE